MTLTTTGLPSRDVRDYGAIGDGVADDTAAFDGCNIQVKTPKGMPQGERDFFSLAESDTDPWIIRNADVTRR